MTEKMRDVFLLNMAICMQELGISVNFPLPAVAPRRAVSPWKAVKCSKRIPNIRIPLSRPRPVTEKSRQKSAQGIREGLDGSNSDPGFELRGKLLYLESIGVDSYQAVSENPSIPSAPVEALQTVVEFLETMGLLKKDLGRVFGMCPEALTASVARELRPVFTFLLREVNVPAADLRRVIRRRPRLLACSVKEQLRPTLYYLQRLGFTEIEVDFYMSMIELLLNKQLENWKRGNVLLHVIGDFSKLSKSLNGLITQAQDYTKHNFGLKFTITLSYSGRYDILQACQQLTRQVEVGKLKSGDIIELLFEKQLKTRYLECVGSPDLLIRTSGQQRLSNFLLWQMTYSELYFMDALWHEFEESLYVEALQSFQHRKRRFGKPIKN